MKEMRNIKIKVNMYDDTKFKIIDTKPERDLIHYIWTRMLTLAGKVNLDGKLYLSSNIPYTDETLAIEFNRDIMQVKLAVKVFLELEMLIVDDDNVYKVKNFSKHQNGSKGKRKVINEENMNEEKIEDRSLEEKVHFISDEHMVNKENQYDELQDKSENSESDKKLDKNKNNKRSFLKEKQVCSDGILELPDKNKLKRKKTIKTNENDILEVKDNKDDELIEFYEGDSRPLGKNEKVIMEFKV